MNHLQIGDKSPYIEEETAQNPENTKMLESSQIINIFSSQGETMKMKLAILDIYNDIAHGDRDRRVHALFTIFLWFAVTTYISLSIFHYIPIETSSMAPYVGSTIATCCVLAVKIS